MGRKAKYTFEQKLKAVLDYQSGKKSAVDIAFELDMGKMVTTEYVNGRISIKLTGKKLSSLKKEIHLTQKNSKNGLSFTFFFSFSLLWFLFYSFSSFSSTFLISLKKTNTSNALMLVTRVYRKDQADVRPLHIS